MRLSLLSLVALAACSAELTAQDAPDRGDAATAPHQIGTGSADGFDHVGVDGHAPEGAEDRDGFGSVDDELDGVRQDASFEASRDDQVAGVEDSGPEDPGGNPGDVLSAPLHLVVVVDIGPRMQHSVDAVRQAAFEAATSLSMNAGPEDVFAVVAHADRRAYVFLEPMSLAYPDQLQLTQHRLDRLQGCGLLDLSMPDPFSQLSHMPACWPDEIGSDPAVGLRLATELLVSLSPADMQPEPYRAVVSLGAGAPMELSAEGLRPANFQEPWPELVLHEGGWAPGALEASAEAEAYALEDLSADVYPFGLGAEADAEFLEDLRRGEGFVIAEPGVPAEALGQYVREAVRRADDARRE